MKLRSPKVARADKPAPPKTPPPASPPDDEDEDGDEDPPNRWLSVVVVIVLGVAAIIVAPRVKSWLLDASGDKAASATVEKSAPQGAPEATVVPNSNDRYCAENTATGDEKTRLYCDQLRPLIKQVNTELASKEQRVKAAEQKVQELEGSQKLLWYLCLAVVGISALAISIAVWALMRTRKPKAAPPPPSP